VTQHPAGAAGDLAVLREQHPGWLFTTVWAAAGTGPDRRLLCAQRHGVVLSDLTPDALSAKIRREEQWGGDDESRDGGTGTGGEARRRQIADSRGELARPQIHVSLPDGPHRAGKRGS
jgi:hypothetical protein